MVRAQPRPVLVFKNIERSEDSYIGLTNFFVCFLGKMLKVANKMCILMHL